MQRVIASTAPTTAESQAVQLAAAAENDPAVTYVLGPTLMPRFLMARFYARVLRRFAPAGERVFLPMPELGGLGRTDRIIDALRWHFEEARARRERVQLVGHSLGGVVGWALLHEYPDVISRAELWCAPVRGTALAPVTAPVAEARFLAPESRWLRRYDHPISGPFVRAVFAALDPLAVPAMRTCYIEGETVENHVVTPVPIHRRHCRPNEFAHTGVGEHVMLPRMEFINRRLAQHDDPH